MAERGDPLVSPIHADLRGLPPLLLQVGQEDLFRDEGLAHVGISEAVDAIRRVADYVGARLERIC